MDSCGIDVCWLLTWELREHEYPPSVLDSLDPRFDLGLPLEGVMEACRRYPGRFVPGYAPDPRSPDACDKLRSAVETRGVRICGEVQFRMCLDIPDVVSILKLSGKLGLPVIFHIEIPHRSSDPEADRDYWYGYDIHALERVLKLCPETNFLGHAQSFWQEISGDADQCEEMYPTGPVKASGRLIRLLREYPNLYCDLSAGSGYTAISRDPSFGRDFLIEFQDRALYARDEFTTRHMDYLRSLELPDDVFAKITAGNALRLVPLGQSH